MHRRAFHLAGFLLSGAVIALAQPAAEKQDKFFNSSGVRIHYTDQGKGEPVVVLHGYAMSGARMESAGLVPGLVQAGYRVLTVDARGHGTSDKPHAPSAYGAEMANDVARLLDQLGITTTHLVGYSMGAIVANKVRELHPSRLRCVVLGGAGWQQPGGDALGGLKGAEIADDLQRTGTYDVMLRRFSAKQVPQPTDEEIRARSQKMVEGNDLEALAAVMRAWDGFAVPESDLRKNSVPTRAIVGGDDPLKVKVDALARVMKNLEVIVIPGVDHAALSHPAFVGHVVEFLKRHALTSATSATTRPPA